MLSTNKHMIKMIFLDNTFMYIPKDYLLDLCDEPWFLKNLIEDVEGNYEKSNVDEIPLLESRENVISVLETLKANTLCLQDNVNLDYLKYLADKWCLPLWVLESIDTKLQEKETIKDDDKLYNNEFIKHITLKCANCGDGYNIFKNEKTSCCYHTGAVSSRQWLCCSQYTNVVNKGCRKSYHVPLSVSNYESIYRIIQSSNGGNNKD